MSRPKLSREFEKLVAQVEWALGGQHAKVTSPDRIQDKDVATRHLREIDVSIRMTVGSAPVLVIIECRNRGRKQDVEWVEQVKAKRDGVGADKAVMVPSHGLTALAREKAAAYGIVVTRFNRINVDDVQSWVRALGVTVTGTYATIRHVDVFLRDALSESDRKSLPQPLTLHVDVFRQDMLSEPDRKSLPQPLATLTVLNTDKIVVSRKTGHGLSVQGVVDTIFPDPPELTKQFLSTLVPGGPAKGLQLRVTFSDASDPYEFLVAGVLHEVSQMRIIVDMSRPDSAVQPFQVYSYGQEGNPTLDVFDYRVPSPSGAEQILSIKRNRETTIALIEIGPPGAFPVSLPEGTSSEEKPEQVSAAPVSDALAEKVRTDKD